MFTIVRVYSVHPSSACFKNPGNYQFFNPEKVSKQLKHLVTSPGWGFRGVRPGGWGGGVTLAVGF